MYIAFDEFKRITLLDASDGGDFTEEMYERVAPMADLIIDNWTLDRVGRAVKNGEDLPSSVKTLYVKIVESLPAIMDNSKVSVGGLVSSFSNGIDSYTFDVTTGMMEQLHQSIGWMLNLLPVEWISACVPFEGGNRYAC